jgi:hypothetical protein
VVHRDLELDTVRKQKKIPPMVWLLLAAILGLLAIVSVGFVDWSERRFVSPDSAWWWLVLAIALAVVALVGWLAYKSLQPNQADPTITPDPPDTTESFTASLFRISPVMIGMAGTVTVGLYLWPLESYAFFSGWGHYAALLGGIIAALVFGWIVALRTSDLTGPKEVHHRVHGELSTIYEECMAAVESFCPPVTQADSSTSLQGTAAESPVGRPPGPSGSATGPQPHDRASARWVLGTGYIDMWNRLHKVEEALFLIKPCRDVAGDGLTDEMRLKDSNINNSTDYVGKLRLAIEVLGGGDYLSTPPPRPERAPKTYLPEEKAQARLVMRGVRHTINQYRDSRREGLVRTRNTLMLTGIVTGLFALMILGLAVLRRIDDTTLVAGVVFYLVGAIVGLFNQMNTASGAAGETEEDFGLTHARLMYTPMLSGLAAIGGVLVVSFLSATLLTTSPQEITGGTEALSEATPSAGPASTSDPESQRYARMPTLGEIFSLEDGQFGIVTAAIFGLTPGLLVDRLKGEGEKYKADLQSTGTQSKG